MAERQNWRGNIWQQSWCLRSNQRFHGDWSIDYVLRACGRAMVECSFVFLLSIPGVESQQSSFSTQSWIIGTMCAVALLVLIALMACFVRRNIGGKYAGTPPLPQRQEMFSMEKGQSVFGQRSALFTSIRIQTNESLIGANISAWLWLTCWKLWNVPGSSTLTLHVHVNHGRMLTPAVLAASLPFLHVPIYPPPHLLITDSGVPIRNLHMQISLFHTTNVPRGQPPVVWLLLLFCPVLSK